jgi:ELWxxDGT repeat protein
VAVAGQRIYFALTDTVWSSDLTAQPLPVGGSFSEPPRGPSGISVVDGRVLFVAHDWTHGKAVWTTDGTPAGTRRLRNGLELEAPEYGENSTRGFVPVGDRVLFPAWSAAHGWEMRSIPRAWVADPLPPLEPDDTDPNAVVLPDVEPSGKVAGLRVRFLRRDDGDVLVVRGRVALPRGTSLASERIIFGVGEYTRAFALDKHGDAEDARGSFRSRKVRGRRAASFVAQIFDADARAALADAGPTLPVGVFFDESLRASAARTPR